MCSPCRAFTFFERAAIVKAERSRIDGPGDSESCGEDVDDDSIYELTVADVHRELASIRKKQSYNDAGFRTRERYNPV